MSPPPSPAASAGDAFPTPCEIIEVRVAELNQIFHSIDPAPFHDKDLDPAAEEFIVSWAREAPPDAALGLRVHLDRPAGLADEAALLRSAIQGFFGRRAQASRRRLMELFRVGRTSLAIGLAVLGVSIAGGELLTRWMSNRGIAEILRESLLIGGWVAMWRPLEIFLYSWWPIRAEAKLFDRLGAMPVRIEYAASTPSEAWRHDWPALARPP